MCEAVGATDKGDECVQQHAAGSVVMLQWSQDTIQRIVTLQSDATLAHH